MTDLTHVNALPALLADTPSVEPGLDEQCPDRCGGVVGHSGAHQSSDYVGTEEVRRLVGAVVARWYKVGLLRFNSHDDGSDDLLLRDEIVRAIRPIVPVPLLPTQASDSPEKTT